MDYKKVFTTLILSFITLVAKSEQPNQHLLLHCLGVEEKSFHDKKLTGPNYLLNQMMINELTGLSGIRLKVNYFKEICQNERSSSLLLLKAMLIHGKKIYNFPAGSQPPVIKREILSAIHDRLPHIFFRYLSSLQATSSNPKCLGQHLTHFNFINERFKYLEGEIHSQESPISKPMILKTFQELRHFNKILIQCEKEQKKLDSDRLKGKSNPKL